MATTQKRTTKTRAAVVANGASESTKRGATSPLPKKSAVTDTMSVTLISLCAKHDVDPKVARAKARRKRDELTPHLFPATSDERWAFKPSSVRTVEAILFGKQ